MTCLRPMAVLDPSHTPPVCTIGLPLHYMPGQQSPWKPDTHTCSWLVKPFFSSCRTAWERVQAEPGISIVLGGQASAWLFCMVAGISTLDHLSLESTRRPQDILRSVFLQRDKRRT